jgi:hypothetical protein
MRKKNKKPLRRKIVLRLLDLNHSKNFGASTCFKIDDAHKCAPLVRCRTAQFLEQVKKRLIRPSSRVTKTHLAGSVR